MTVPQACMQRSWGGAQTLPLHRILMSLLPDRRVQAGARLQVAAILAARATPAHTTHPAADGVPAAPGGQGGGRSP